MKKILLMLLAAAMTLSVCCCAGTNGKEEKDGSDTEDLREAKDQKEEKDLPEIHAIAYDESMDTLKDEAGADAFNHKLDHAESRYYKILDYYNMESDETLHILSHFETYQQTTEYSCACASALMVLNYYGNHDYNELDICRMVDTDTSEGTSVENIAGFFDSIGWKTTSHADTKRYFESLDDFETFILNSLDNGTPVMVDWMDWGGHWQVIIGLDTIGTDDPNDDVLIMADPYDTTDHYQDGYYTVPLGRFFYMWREGSGGDTHDPYVQPFVVAAPYNTMSPAE